MRFEKRKVNGPCGENCCQTRTRIVAINQHDVVIDYYGIMRQALSWNRHFDDRMDAIEAFLERQYAQQQARIEAQQGAAVLSGILNDNAFALFDAPVVEEVEVHVRVNAVRR